MCIYIYYSSNDPFTLPDANPQGPIAAILEAGGVVAAPTRASIAGKYTPKEESLDNANPYMSDGPLNPNLNPYASEVLTSGSNLDGHGVDGGPSLNSDMSSSAASNGIKRYPKNYGKLTDKQLANLAPFVPYRVDEKNMQAMEDMFQFKSIQPQKTRVSSRSKAKRNSNNVPGSAHWKNGHDQNGRYAPTWDGIVAENSILTMDSNMDDGVSTVDNSYYNVPSLFDGEESQASNTRGMNDSIFSDSNGDDGSIGNGHGGRSIVDFDDNSTAYGANNQLLSTNIVAAYTRADEYTSREREMAEQQGPTGKASALSTSNTNPGLHKPSLTPPKYEHRHYKMSQRGLFREQSNSFEQSYAHWDPQTIQPATNLYGGSTLSGGPGAIENPNEELSVNSWDGYGDGDVDTFGSPGGSVNERQRARSQEDEALAPQYTASNRLFRTKSVLPAIDKYYGSNPDSTPANINPGSAPGSSQSPARLVFNGVSDNENMGTYNSQQRRGTPLSLGLGATSVGSRPGSIQSEYRTGTADSVGMPTAGPTRADTAAGTDCISRAGTASSYGGGNIPSAGTSRAGTAHSHLLVMSDSRAGTAELGLISAGPSRQGTANSSYFPSGVGLGAVLPNSRNQTPAGVSAGAVVASAGPFVDYNSGHVGGIGGFGGGGSVVSMLSRQTMEMNYTVSDAGSEGHSTRGKKKRSRGKNTQTGRGGNKSGGIGGAESVNSIHTQQHVSDADMMLSKLDPLSLNITAALRPKFSAYALSEAVDGDDDDEWDFDDDDTALTGDQSAALSHLESVAQGRPNVLAYGDKKRMRIRAEKLVDYSFTRKLFIQNKATLQDSQALIQRMESILELLDTEHTGYVSWESFSRLILSLAPPHLLRADVMTFLNAQSCNSVDLVDYREFIISGKVMIISKETDDPSKIPMQGWLNRQAKIVGEASTYTWKNHVQWYRGRKAQSMIWLMRYGQRAILLGDKMAVAQRWLAEIGKKARAKTHLMSCGEKALYAEELRLSSMKAIVRRCIRARRFLTAKDEASRYLFYIGDSCKKFMEEKTNEDNLSKALERIMRKKKVSLVWFVLV